MLFGYIHLQMEALLGVFAVDRNHKIIINNGIEVGFGGCTRPTN